MAINAQSDVGKKTQEKAPTAIQATPQMVAGQHYIKVNEGI